nr:MAG TPA: hypothetical protein [Caudoviricetes sp.]
MWKAPQRPKHEITQGFSDGIVTIYAVENVAQPGYKPQEGLKKKITLRYAERQLGINRLYLSRQNQAEIERVLRVPDAGSINTQNVAVTEDGQQYRIALGQKVADVWPPCVDISLVQVKQKYETGL